MVSSPLLQLMCVSSHVLALVLGSLSMVLCCVQLFGVSVQFNHFHLIIFISFGCSTFIMTGTGYFYCSSTTFCLPCFFCPLPAQLTTVYLLVNLGQVCLLGSSFAADSIIETMAHVKLSTSYHLSQALQCLLHLITLPKRVPHCLLLFLLLLEFLYSLFSQPGHKNYQGPFCRHGRCYLLISGQWNKNHKIYLDGKLVVSSTKTVKWKSRMF